MPENKRPAVALQLEPQYREYVWGGMRLRPGRQTAEAWIVHEDDRILSGALSGKTLREAAALLGSDLLGSRVIEQTGERFPLLIKLLDCAQWLSLQVHPNDEQAERLEGPGHFGKTEAWHILEAEPGAEILCGFRPGVSEAEVSRAVREGQIVDYTQRLPMQAGDTVFIQAGTLHALGPGLLVYEVQQTSDITYRVFDWNRPASAGRPLHIEQSLAVLDPRLTGQAIPQPRFIDGGESELVRCPYFTLALLTGESAVLAQDTMSQSFHALTVIEGQAEVRGDGWAQPLRRFETVVVPAACGPYTVHPQGHMKMLKAMG